jgi:hypothetical protein
MVSRAKKNIIEFYRDDINVPGMDMNARSRKVEYLLDSDRFQCRSDKYNVSFLVAFTMLIVGNTTIVNGIAVPK